MREIPEFIRAETSDRKIAIRLQIFENDGNLECTLLAAASALPKAAGI